MRPGRKDIAATPAQDLPGASRGSRDRWKSMINGGSPEQPDKDGTARHDQADAPAKPVAPEADLSGRPVQKPQK
ncbi:hypothetical protein [Aestuariivirga litoralis]|uniref:hypothetical protein n=1 Tax=Aestuariivirga litoralis TaxID=2650924 RepID=UPI0018C4A224|nr:hypothetical protein [Aestuariivirga litoralis]MBG1231478.1 hypothetical protein [Aestuariivirga litoralis]